MGLRRLSSRCGGTQPPRVSVVLMSQESKLIPDRSNLFITFDNKILFVTGVVLFEVGSAVCGASPNMNALIFGRVICGFGGVGIYVGCMNILSVLTSEAERPLYLNFVGLTWGTSTV
jgi:MFS family permease